jgi:hypothetical protein
MYQNSVIKNTNGMTFNPTTTLEYIYITSVEYAFQKLSQVLYTD